MGIGNMFSAFIIDIHLSTLALFIYLLGWFLLFFFHLSLSLSLSLSPLFLSLLVSVGVRAHLLE